MVVDDRQFPATPSDEPLRPLDLPVGGRVDSADPHAVDDLDRFSEGPERQRHIFAHEIAVRPAIEEGDGDTLPVGILIEIAAAEPQRRAVRGNQRAPERPAVELLRFFLG